MLILIKKISLPVLFALSISVSANELVEVNMESVLEVGRENQQLSASSQDKIDSTERHTCTSKVPGESIFDVNDDQRKKPNSNSSYTTRY